ncbi:error-prone DNA polymerase (plasmid) [Abditibacteriota bacterium]|nr:error-prone DNA polymerase [Abditibacteriota bacterium]
MRPPASGGCGASPTDTTTLIQKPVTHLHVRSWFSFGAGASSPALLARLAAHHGQSALALTDTCTFAGAVRHARACRFLGLRSLFGASVEVEGSPQVLLCANGEGHANACDLLTTAHRRAAERGDRKHPHLLLDDLRGHTDGLFCLGGSHESALYQLLDARQWSKARAWAAQLAQLFPGRFFIELVHNEREGDTERLRQLLELAEVLGLPTVATNAVRHATPPEYALFDALTCMRLGLNVAQNHPQRPRNSSAFLCDEKRLLHLGLPLISLANSDAIARECHVDLTPGEVTPPRANVPDGMTATSYLKRLCVEGLKARGLGTSRAAKEQVRREVETVSKLELEEFFLVVREVVAFARSRGIRCSGRGSAANSLIAYLLGITEVDPLRHHLLFERFLHEGRRGMPDIDVDFETHRRAEVIAWMHERWGEEHTAMTANTVTFRLRSAVRDMGKVLGFPLPLLDSVTKYLPHSSARHALEFRGELGPLLGDGPALSVLLGLCAALHDGEDACPRHLSLHSGGMVLSRLPLRHISPIQTSANGVRQVQFNKDDVEALGLIKFDVLGLRMLSVITEATQLLQNLGEAAPDVDALPADDAKTFDLIQRGQTLGVFQIESPGQWNLLARSQPETFDDLVAQVALFRPGPLQGNMVHPYIERRRGWKRVVYPHPCLEPVLRDTYGIILYQEQVLEVAHRFAGMPLQEADDFRRLMSRERDREQMEAMRDKFVQSAVCAHAASSPPITPALAHTVFDLLSKFVGYGFCRSHAAAFARTVYQSAYLKAHHPAAYMAGVLEHKPGFFPEHTLLEEARLLGVRVLPPCIHQSGVSYSLERVEGEESAIRVPLTQIETLSSDRAARVVLERGQQPFASLDDLFQRVELVPEVWDNLARSGTLATFGTRREVLWHLGRLQKLKSKRASEQLSLNELELPRDRVLLEVPTLTQHIVWDFQISHLTTGPHPLALQRAHLERLGAYPLSRVFSMNGERKVLVAGSVISRQRPPTAKGFCFLILEDETGRLPTALPPHLYEKFERVLREPMLVVEGRLESPPEERRSRSKPGIYRSVLIERIWSLTELLAPAATVYGATGLPGENPRQQQRGAV